jgi:hypothetical protein
MAICTSRLVSTINDVNAVRTAAPSPFTSSASCQQLLLSPTAQQTPDDILRALLFSNCDGMDRRSFRHFAASPPRLMQSSRAEGLSFVSPRPNEPAELQRQVVQFCVAVHTHILNSSSFQAIEHLRRRSDVCGHDPPSPDPVHAHNTASRRLLAFLLTAVQELEEAISNLMTLSRLLAMFTQDTSLYRQLLRDCDILLISAGAPHFTPLCVTFQNRAARAVPLGSVGPRGLRVGC